MAIVPYCSDDEGRVNVYWGDCRDVLPSLGEVGLVLTDPPYAIGAGRGEWAATAAVAVGLHLAAGKVKDGGAMLCFSTSSGRGMEYTMSAVSKSLPFNRLLVWRKPFGTSKAAGPFKWDIVSILAFGRATFGTADRSAYIETCEPKKGREHPAQVPRDVAEWLYRPFDAQGLTVLDPFAGSGRLLEPAIASGRHVIAIEKEERYCELLGKKLIKRAA